MPRLRSESSRTRSSSGKSKDPLDEITDCAVVLEDIMSPGSKVKSHPRLKKSTRINRKQETNIKTLSSKNQKDLHKEDQNQSKNVYREKKPLNKRRASMGKVYMEESSSDNSESEYAPSGHEDDSGSNDSCSQDFEDNTSDFEMKEKSRKPNTKKKQQRLTAAPKLPGRRPTTAWTNESIREIFENSLTGTENASLDSAEFLDNLPGRPQLSESESSESEVEHPEIKVEQTDNHCKQHGGNASTTADDIGANSKNVVASLKIDMEKSKHAKQEIHEPSSSRKASLKQSESMQKEKSKYTTVDEKGDTKRSIPVKEVRSKKKKIKTEKTKESDKVKGKKVLNFGDEVTRTDIIDDLDFHLPIIQLPSTSKIVPINADLDDMSEDSDDGNWQDVDEVKPGGLPSPKKVTKSREEHHKGVEVSLKVSNIHMDRKRKREEKYKLYIERAIRRFKREVQVNVHKVHLLCLVAHARNVNEKCQRKFSQAMCLSIVPDYIASVPISKFNVFQLSRFVAWFKDACQGPGFLCLQNAFKTQNVTFSVLLPTAQILVSMLRVLGLLTRLVLSLQPLSPKVEEQSKNKIQEKKKERQKKEKLMHQSSGKETGKVNLTKKGAMPEHKGIPRVAGTRDSAQSPYFSKNSPSKSSEDKLPKACTGKQKRNIPTVAKTRDHSLQLKKERKDLGKKNATNEPVSKRGGKQERSVENKKSSRKTLDGAKSDEGHRSSTDQGHAKARGHTRNEEKETSKNSRTGGNEKIASSSINSKKMIKTETKKKQEDAEVGTSKGSFSKYAQRSTRTVQGEEKGSSMKKSLTNKTSRSLRQRARVSYAGQDENKDDGNDGNETDHSYTQEYKSHDDDDFEPSRNYRSPGCEETNLTIAARKELELHYRVQKKLLEEISDEHTFEKSSKPLKKRKMASKGKQKVISSDSSDIAEENDWSPSGVDVWVEVFLEAEDKWICIELYSWSINRVENCEKYATQPLQYVIGVDNDGAIKDVTCRYASKWLSQTRKRRIDRAWWQDTLTPFLPKNTTLNNKEDRELSVSLTKQPMPSTVGEFKDHPLYVLRRHLLKFEAIYPESVPPLGWIRNEPIYPRDSVHVLHSRESWMKEARVVRKGEIAYKVVKGRPKKNTPSHERDKIKLDLFGIWQTEIYKPPPAKDGKVPRNEYGNIELFKPSMLPPGTVHIPIQGILKVAKKLQIDAAPAMIGWEAHCGYSVPVFEGVVVCKEFEDTLLDAWNRMEEEMERKRKEKREKRVLERWKLLVRGLMVRERLKRKYTFHDEDDSTNSEPPPKRTKEDDDYTNLSVSWPRNRMEGTTSIDDEGHCHIFPKASHQQDSLTGLWSKTCSCGLTLPLET